MSRIVGWLGKGWYAILTVLFAWLVIGLIWEGWILPIWMNPRGFIQGVFIVCLGLYATFKFFQLDKKYTKAFDEQIGFWQRILQIAKVLAAMIAILAIGFFFFFGIWPDGIAFSLSGANDNGP